MAFEKQKDYFFKISTKDEPNKSILYLSALYLAAEEIHNSLKSQDSKNRIFNIDEVKDPTKMQAKQFKQSKNSEKYDKLLNLKEKIFKLIDKENLSFRDVSAFLKKYHKFEVSHSYIATFYHKTKEN